MDDRSPESRSKTMAAVRSTDTSPELALRSVLHARGRRFRLGQRVLLGGRTIRPDIVFKGARVAVFLDGCFWHGCGQHCRMPTSNQEYWQRKIGRNVERDAEVDAILSAAGWTVVRVWEHDPAERAASLVESELDSAIRRRASARRATSTLLRDRT